MVKFLIAMNINNNSMFLQEILDQNLSARVEELLPPIGIHVNLYFCICCSTVANKTVATVRFTSLALECCSFYFGLN